MRDDLSHTYDGLLAADRRSVPKAAARGNTMTRETLRQYGEATLQKLFESSEQTPGLANLLTEPVFGGVWNRPGLALSDRLLCTIAALATGPRMRSLRQYI